MWTRLHFSEKISVNVDQDASVSKSHLQPYSRTETESGDGGEDESGQEAQEDVEDPLDTLALWGMCLDQTGQFLIQQNRLQEAEEMFNKAWVGRPNKLKHNHTGCSWKNVPLLDQDDIV